MLLLYSTAALWYTTTSHSITFAQSQYSISWGAWCEILISDSLNLCWIADRCNSHNCVCLTEKTLWSFHHTRISNFSNICGNILIFHFLRHSRKRLHCFKQQRHFRDWKNKPEWKWYFVLSGAKEQYCIMMLRQKPRNHKFEENLNTSRD